MPMAVCIETKNLYRIQPFDGDMHLLIHVDQTRLPKDHEPDYEESLDQPVGHEPESLPQPVPVKDCSTYKVIMAYTEKAGEEIFRQYARSYPTLNKDQLIGANFCRDSRRN